MVGTKHIKFVRNVRNTVNLLFDVYKLEVLKSLFPESYDCSEKSKGVKDMLKFSEKDIEFINKNFDNSNEILQSDDRRFVLLQIFDLLTKKGFDGYYYNELGEEAQKVYDSIYLNNK